MNNDTQKISIHERVLDRIKRGEVKMRPHWHFVLKAALTIAGVALIALTLLFVISFALFALRASGLWFIPIFGWRGFAAFLWSLPWLLVLVAVIFIVLLELLVRHYSFGYRWPLLYLAIGLALLATIGGVLLAQTPIHGRLLEQAKFNRLPLVGSFYRRYGMPHMRNVHVGTIIELTDQGLTIKTPYGETLHIAVTAETRFPFGLDLQSGDQVVIFGERGDGTVQALGIKRIDSEQRNMHFRDRYKGPAQFFRPTP